jgi:hypothetical protein
MKIFISHSSKNANYGNALVDLLTGVGINHDSIIFTSNTSYGIPVASNIFIWLRSRISEQPFVIYLLSPEYYSSVACLNEMGAAWVVENQHAAIFTPNFDLNSSDYRNGVLDPREIGFFISDEDRVTEFIESLRENFAITTNQIVIKNKRRMFIETIKLISKESGSKKDFAEESETATEKVGGKLASAIIDKPRKEKTGKDLPSLSSASFNELNSDFSQSSGSKKVTPTERYFQDLADGKLKDEEVMIIYYASDTGQSSLGTGWKANEEVTRIQGWEELNEICDTLSTRYEQAINRLDLRTLTEVSERTSHGNPRLVTLVDEMKEKLLELPEEFFAKCEEITRQALEVQAKKVKNEIPF